MYKNVNIDVQCMQFSNLEAYNNPRKFDMLLKSVNQSKSIYIKSINLKDDVRKYTWVMVVVDLLSKKKKKKCSSG